jgi:hypothetical protein
MDVSLKATTNGRGVPSVLTFGATLNMLGHDCHEDCTRIGEFDARVRFIRRPVCPVPGSVGSLIVDFAVTDLPVLDRLRLLREINRCARADHIRVLARSSSDRGALTSVLCYQHRADGATQHVLSVAHEPLH